MNFFEKEPGSGQTLRSAPGPEGPPVLQRKLVAIGALLLIFLLLVLGVRGCLSARKDRAFKNYVRDAAELTNDSVATGRDFFALLEKPGNATPLELESRINSFRASADQLSERAQDLDPPDELDTANRWLGASLEFRRDGLDETARLVTSALAKKKNNDAVDRIAGQMQTFLTSDVVYLQRYIPDTLAQLNKRDLADQTQIPEKRFLSDISWLLPETVANRLGAISGSKAAAPGIHGLALTKVLVEPSGTELNQDQTTTVAKSSKIAFTVELQNQGENEEKDVAVRISVGDTDLEKTVSRVAAGDSTTVTIPLAATAPSGPTTVDVKVGPVAGEKLTDNNEATYPVVFASS